MIEVQNLVKNYKNISALAGVSMTAQKGKVTGFIGPNGCGKSTLIKSILGLVIPDSGEVLVNNKSIRNQDEYRKFIGYMPQSPAFPENLTVREVLFMLEDLRDQKAILKDELIQLFELESQLDKQVSQLSGGTKQKVSIVVALMFDPEIIILDEPTVGLDPLQAIRFKKLLKSLVVKNKTIILVSHIISEVELLVDEMVFMLDGKVKFAGTIDAIKNHFKDDMSGSYSLEDSILKFLNR